MTTQPEALRLADKMSSYSLSSGYAWHCHKAAAELRRLHESNQELLAALKVAKTIIGHPDDAHTRMIADVINKAERTTT
jgi:hypothetical protein